MIYYVIYSNHVFSCSVPGQVAKLRCQMLARRQQAFRPETRINYMIQIRAYIAFCIHFKLDYQHPSPETLCLFVEFLALSFHSPGSVKNYLSGVRIFFKLQQQSPKSLDCFQLQLMLRAVDITMEHTPSPKLPLTEDMLQKMCELCDTLKPNGIVAKCAILLVFFGFLRQSNLGPSKAGLFDIKRHLCRGDVFITATTLAVIIKWTKTIQNHQNPQVIQLPSIPRSTLCPVTTFQQMCKQVPHHSHNSPLFVIRQNSHTSRRDTFRPMTSAWLADVFNELLIALGYARHSYSLHSLRRGGATAAFKAGADHALIKRHGTWRSDVFWQYISADASSNRAVPHRMASRIKQLFS